jgi:hypothetical protein
VKSQKLFDITSDSQVWLVNGNKVQIHLNHYEYEDDSEEEEEEYDDSPKVGKNIAVEVWTDRWVSLWDYEMILPTFEDEVASNLYRLEAFFHE